MVKNQSTHGISTNNATSNTYKSSDEESINDTTTIISSIDNGNFAPVTRDTLQPLMMEEYQMDKRIERHSLLKSLTFLLF